MLTLPNLISLPCAPDLVESGIACACRSLAGSGVRTGGPALDRLRDLVAGVVVELAFRRYLNEQAVPFGVLGAAPFSDPDHYDVSLGGHRCDLRSTLVSRRREITLLRRERGNLLQAPALIPVEEFAAADRKPDDIQLFAFLLGLVAPSRQDVDRALSAGQPVCLVHPLPMNWRRPSVWVPLEKLALKSECDQPVTVELTGQDAERNFITRAVDLLPRTRTEVPGGFCSLTCLRTGLRPAARIGIHSPLRGDACLVSPYDWGNVWVYGMEILLAGWLTHEDYRRKATVLNPGAHSLLIERTREKNLFVPVEELNPLAPLFSKVKAWAGGASPGNRNG